MLLCFLDPGFSERLINELQRVQVRLNNHHRKLDGEQDSQSDHKKDINAFSPSTVRYVCSKVLKDRENEVRTEYDKVLNQKLSGKCCDSVGIFVWRKCWRG